MKLSIAILLLSALILAQQNAVAPGPLNLQFNEGQPGEVPPGWYVPPALLDDGYSAELRREGCHGSNGCAVVIVPPNAPATTKFGNMMQRFFGVPYRGKKIRLRAWIKLEPADKKDRAQMWLRVDRHNGQVGLFNNMDGRPVTKNEWTQVEITGRVDKDAETINIGIISVGKGRAWIDGVEFEILDN
jgi:hypothetical protein